MRFSFAVLSAALVFMSGPSRGAESAPPPPATPAAAAPELKAGNSFPARDTLDAGKEDVADAVACLDGLKWTAGDFPVQLEAARGEAYEWLVRFPSPFPSGDAVNDRVSMEWYMAKDEKGRPVQAPAVVVVHESGRGMVVGRTFARGLRGLGLHTFLIHLPGYGARESEFTRDIKKMLPALKQAVGDVRRARDAVAVLPYVDGKTVGLQGTSMGGFIAASVAGLDRGYGRIFIVLAGGNIAEALLTGKRDAASMRRQFAAAGITDAQIRDLSQIIEPTRLAHRIDPANLWLFSGKFDDVVPPACSDAFAKAAKLAPAHHYILPFGHYTGAILLPAMVPEIGKLMRAPSAPPGLGGVDGK